MNISLTIKSKKIITIIAICAFITQTLYAQEYAITTIPDSLTKSADAIVRANSEEFIQTDINNAVYTIKTVITVLNKNGDRFAHFSTMCDDFVDLKDFEGIIRDPSGKIVKKIKKGDLITSSISEQMATDSYVKAYYYQSPSYPFTVEYNYQKKWKNRVIYYPYFLPYQGIGIAVEKSDLRIEVPSNIDLRHRANYNTNLKEENLNGKKIYTVSATGLKPVNKEILMPPSHEYFPSVLFAPNDFCYDSYCGNMSTWKNYGAWMAQLLKDRDALPADIVTQIQAMTANAESEREKVQILYKYLQDNFRYVSIQLGIGGLQPISASSVMKTKYGDCKGLSNLMKAMLKAVNIPSNYCEISMEKYKDLYKDFANVTQTNHVILLVPLKNDSIWLECTSQYLPFGYVHNGIAGHDALVISEDGNGGKLCRLPIYTDAANRTISNLDLYIQEDGSVKGDLHVKSYIDGYENTYYTFRSKDRTKLIDFFNKQIKLPKVKVGEIKTNEVREEIPYTSFISDFESADFASKTGSRLFVPICPLYKGNYNIFTSDNRISDIDISNTTSEYDTIAITIPPTYIVESLPKDVELKTRYGTLYAYARQDGNKIIYTQNIDIPAKRYEASSYKDIKDFFAQVSSTLKRKIVLKKE